MSSPLFFWLLRRRASDCAGAFFHYTTPGAICQEFFSEILHKYFFPILCILPIAFYYWVWYTIIVKRGRDELFPQGCVAKLAISLNKTLTWCSKIGYTLFAKVRNKKNQVPKKTS